MRKRTYFRVCPDCGSHLDAGEICECRRETKDKTQAVSIAERERSKIIRAYCTERRTEERQVRNGC